MKRSGWTKEIFSYMIVAALTIVVLCLVYWGIDMARPMIYSGDGVSASYLVKTINETGWFLENPWVGGAYGANWGDYTMCDNLSFILVKFFCLFSDNCFLIFNLFYFSTFVLVSLAAYFVFRSFQVETVVAMTGSLLYSFLAYHQQRLPHVWLTPYFMVPLGLLVGIWIAYDEYHMDTLQWRSLFRQKKIVASSVILFLSAFTGFYYAFFTCVVICIAGVIAVLRKRTFKRVLFIAYSLFVVCLGVVANVYPSLLYWMKEGVNQDSELLLRGSESSEVYALKMIQLLMPRMEHRLQKLADIAASYYDAFPLNNENQSATLGVVGVVGFILLLLLMFKPKGDRKYVTEIKKLNIGIFLVATIGGVGGIFGLCFSTPMRCYNRLSIYIAFLALLYLALITTDLFGRYGTTRLRRAVCFCSCLIVLGIGLWDQTVNVGEAEQAEETRSFDSDRNFVQELEAKLPEKSMVFQLPFMKFPSESSYELFTGYIHSTHTIWSYGGMQGREEDEWEMGLKADSVDEFLKHICEAGYRGLYIDRRLYAEEGYDFADLQQQLDSRLKTKPLVSEDGRLYFYELGSI